MELNDATPGFHIGIQNVHLNVKVPQALLTQVVTTNGSVHVSQMYGDSNVHTSNGSVTMETDKGNVTVDTSNGAVTLNHLGGQVEVRTSNGLVKGESSLGGNWSCTTSNGQIRLTIPSTSSATLDATTSNSSIGGDVPWALPQKHHGTARIGAGTYQMVLHTSNGSVNVNYN